MHTEPAAAEAPPRTFTPPPTSATWLDYWPTRISGTQIVERGCCAQGFGLVRLVGVLWDTDAA